MNDQSKLRSLRDAELFEERFEKAFEEVENVTLFLFRFGKVLAIVSIILWVFLVTAALIALVAVALHFT